jgi:O-antigen ligase
MPPILALLLCLPAIVWALRLEARTGHPLTGRIWIPFLWLLILGSRPLSFWLGVQAGGDVDAMDGNTFDRNLYLVMTFAAIYQLNRRQINWGNILRDNTGIVLMYGYLLATCILSDVPFVTFKRWFKDLSAIPVLLILFTYANPHRVTKSLFTKSAIIWFLLSVVSIKYFPDLGRVFSNSGGVQIIGITNQKNTLGEIVLVSLIVIIWGATRLEGRGAVKKRFMESLPVWIAVSTGVWLLEMSDSKTSMICLAYGVFALMGHRLPFLRNSPKLFLSICFLVIPMGYLIDQMFGISGALLELIGRNPTLTGRTGIWDAVKEHPVNPVFGGGYLMYWDELGEVMINGYPTTLKTAHNGYLDLYLDGGWLAIGIFIPMLIFVMAKIARTYLSGAELGRIQLAIFLVLLLANLSESTIFRRSPLWFAFLVFCLDYSRAFQLGWTSRQAKSSVAGLVAGKSLVGRVTVGRVVAPS